MQVGINEFAKRHTRESKFSYYSGSWESLQVLVEKAMLEGKTSTGYKEGVLLVEVPPEGFFSGVVKLKEGMEIHASFERRRPEEEPLITKTAEGEKVPARVVEVVIYSNAVLLEGKENSTDLPWEIISINARTALGSEPMDIGAMCRNQLMLEGGTGAVYSSEEWANAVYHWLTHANVYESKK